MTADAPMLETPRLRLRQPAERDIPAIIAIAGDWEVARRLARMPHPYTLADARFFLDRVVTSESTWAITVADAMIGCVGLAPLPDGSRELGYYVGRPWWGRGYASEAAGAIVAHAFGTLGLDIVHSGHFADNPASGRVLTKIGFEVTGTGERPNMAAGRPMPSVEMRLTRSRWNALRRSS